MPWWRFYGEMMRDPKIRRRPISDRWCWCALLTIANEAPERGYLLVEGDVMTTADLEDMANVSPKEAASAIAYFREKEMVVDDAEGIPFVPAFLERQYESDSSTQRTAKHRSKERSSNVPENMEGTFSPMGQRTESSSVCLESEEIQEKRDDDFERFWAVYPRHVGKRAAQRALQKALTSTDIETLLAGAIRLRDDPNRIERFTPHPTTWLNQGRWDDDPLPSVVERRSKQASGLSAVMDEIERALP